jgi:hypothetical protein
VGLESACPSACNGEQRAASVNSVRRVDFMKYAAGISVHQGD